MSSALSPKAGEPGAPDRPSVITFVPSTATALITKGGAAMTDCLSKMTGLTFTMNVANDQTDSKNNITRSGQILVAMWAVGLIAFFIVVGYFVLSDQVANKMAAIARHNSRIDPNLTEAGQTAADTVLPPGAKPVEVKSGIYLDRIAAISIRDNSWTADFYIWFNWKGDAVKPGDNFQIVDG